MPDQTFYHLQSLLGILVLLGFAWASSENRAAFPFRTVLAGLALRFQVIVKALTGAAKAGTSFGMMRVD